YLNLFPSVTYWGIDRIVIPCYHSKWFFAAIPAGTANFFAQRLLSPFVPKTKRPSPVAVPSFPTSTAGACKDSLFPTDHGSLITDHSVVCQCPLPLLCFQQLPTIKVCNPFILITMQIARGVVGTRPTAHLKKNFNFFYPWSSSVATRHSPLSSIFNNLRTLSFYVDKRVQANSFAINCLRTLLQNMGGGGSSRPRSFKYYFNRPSDEDGCPACPERSRR